jgi:arsenite methyltransferase
MNADARFWDNIAESYAAKPVEDPAAFERKIAFTLERMRPDHVVLDVGCGTGSLALRFAPHAAVVHGLDLSPAMVAIARRKASDQGVTNVMFHEGTLEGFGAVGPESVDLVYAGALLHLVGDLAGTLARIYGLLKPGGLFVSSTPCLGESNVPYGLILPVMTWLGKAPRVQVLGREAVARETRAAGFSEVAFVDVGADATIAFQVARKPQSS